MGLWAGIKAMFGSGEAAQQMVGGVIAATDAMVFTEEEKSQANFMLLQLQIKYAEATTGSRLARRYLAIMVTACYLFWFSVAGFMVLFSKDPKEIVELLTSLAVGGSFAAIISWYFFTGSRRDKAE